MNQGVMDEITAGNAESMRILVEQEGVELRRLPDDVLQEFKRISEDVMRELGESDPMAKRVYDSYKTFQDKMLDFNLVSEEAFEQARRL